MTVMHPVIRFGILCTLLLGGLSFADDVRELSWDDLIPEGQLPQPAPQIDHSGAGGVPMISPAFSSGVVDELNGIQAKLPGFIVPLEIVEGGKVKEFLFVPYFGACIHYPPPPPNQIVYVVLDEAITLESPWDPYWATGELKTEFRGSDLGSAGYTMLAEKLEVYEW